MEQGSKINISSGAKKRFRQKLYFLGEFLVRDTDRFSCSSTGRHCVSLVAHVHE